MEKIKLGSLCLTKCDKTTDYRGKNCVIKSGTLVSVCDDSIKEGYVLVEIEGYDEVFGYSIEELSLVKNYL